jgi:hypothetical protein
MHKRASCRLRELVDDLFDKKGKRNGLGRQGLTWLT